LSVFAAWVLAKYSAAAWVVPCFALHMAVLSNLLVEVVPAALELAVAVVRNTVAAPAAGLLPQACYQSCP
jgi:hypothetical protein